MSHQLLPASARLAQPWKNGGVVTREIAAHPPGADLASFDWRISTATVATAGPFSQFPGVDRVLLVLEGALALRIDGGPTQVLGPEDAPLHFSGDLPVDADLASGPVTDLNIMVRRGAWAAEVQRIAVAAPISLAAVGAAQVAVALGALLVEGAPTGFADAVRFEEPLSVAPASGPTELILIRLSARA